MKWAMMVLGLGIWLAASCPTMAGDDAGQAATAPPARPLPITHRQMQVIDELAVQPLHAQVATVRAAYSPETARKMTEIGVHATQAIMPTTVLTLLILAAPL